MASKSVDGCYAEFSIGERNPLSRQSLPVHKCNIGFVCIQAAFTLQIKSLLMKDKQICMHTHIHTYMHTYTKSGTPGLKNKETRMVAIAYTCMQIF